MRCMYWYTVVVHFRLEKENMHTWYLVLVYFVYHTY